MARPPTHAAGVKLQRVIKKIRRHLFVFITNRAIPATNNGSERALRPCVIFRKITNGFRTELTAVLACHADRVLSFLGKPVSSMIHASIGP
jgi:hypothetical protein